MKLLIATGLFYPSKLGGPANTLYWLAKALVKSGIKVEVVTSSNHINEGMVPIDEWTIVDGIHVCYCSGSAALSCKQLRLAKQKVKQADVVMLSSAFTVDNFFIGLIAKHNKKSIIWSPRGEFLESAMGVGSRLKKIYSLLIKQYFGKTVTFHATSYEEKQAILSLIGANTKTVILPNYIEVPTRLERLDTQNPYIVYVGRIAPIKAIDNLLEGLSLSKKFMQSNYVLKIVGGVEDKFIDFYDKLQDMRISLELQDKIEFVGPKSGTEKYQLYADARFSMLVSKSENFGNVVIEALSQGTPVIASHGTPWQILEERNAGFWIDNSPQAIAECVDKVLSMDESSYIVMRANAFKLVEEYDVTKNVQKWVEVLERMSS